MSQFPAPPEIRELPVVAGTPIAAERREVGNSISLVTAEQIEATPGASMEEILQGRTLGLVISSSRSQPAAGSALILRGVNSIESRNQPIVYVDGVRIFSEAWETEPGMSGENITGLGGVAPRDIERIEVIKGAAASTLYGSEAAAGVIQIFTKRGWVGAPRWSVKQPVKGTRPHHFLSPPIPEEARTM